MFFYKTRYNNELYHVRRNHEDGFPTRVEIDCTSLSGIFDVHGKKYMKISLKDSDFMSELSNMERCMNEYFKKEGQLSSVLCVKIPYRYGKFEIKFTNETHFLTTSDDLQPNMLLRVVLEMSTIYDFGVNWIIRTIMVLNK
jgi:hypothetical protein